MKPDEMKALACALKELNEDYVDFLQSVKGAVKEVKTTRQLWRNGNRSRLIKLGLALIVFPEPTPISETVGSFLVVAGTIQEGIRRRALYIEDIPKAFYSLLKDLQEANKGL
jgi:hypothetical protein